MEEKDLDIDDKEESDHSDTETRLKKLECEVVLLKEKLQFIMKHL